MLSTYRSSILIVTALLFGACASPNSKQLAQQQQEDRAKLSQEQNEERAKLDRQQEEERAHLAADQERKEVSSDVKSMKKDLTQGEEQAKFAISAREDLAKIDARIEELRRTGKTVDAATVRARNALAAHIDACNAVLSPSAWATEKAQIQSEQAALENQVDRIAQTG